MGCDDCTVRILSLDPDSTLESKSVQALTAAPSSLSIMAMEDTTGGSRSFLHIGLHSGVYLRTVLDEITGELTDTRQKFLGPKPVRLFQVAVQEQPCVLALQLPALDGIYRSSDKRIHHDPSELRRLGMGLELQQ